MFISPPKRSGTAIQVNIEKYKDIIKTKFHEFKQSDGTMFCTKHADHNKKYCEVMCGECVKV